MRKLKESYFWVVAGLLLSSAFVNFVWTGKTWPGYYTLCTLLILIVIKIMLYNYDKRESKKSNK
ncbi:hypothetical protein COK39_24680 [Priestia megaterium]|nr:hypothetical protein COK39_24680 [Priestia megaterium]